MELTAEEASSVSGFSEVLKKGALFDDDGFVKGFDWNHEAPQAQEFFDKWGFVVFRETITAQQCQDTINEFWQRVVCQTPSTNLDLFRRSQPFAHLGIIGARPEILPCQLANRQSAGVLASFRAVHQWPKEKGSMMVDHDRMGVMFPVKHHPEWRTRDRWLHLDCNPRSGRIDVASFRKKEPATQLIDFSSPSLPRPPVIYVQGVLTLADCPVEDGGFHCVPGSCHLLSHYLRLIDHLIDTGRTDLSGSGHLQLPEDHALRKNIFRVPVRAGSLIIWNALTLHGNFPNQSSRYRYVQYLRMLPDRPCCAFAPLFSSKEELMAAYRMDCAELLNMPHPPPHLSLVSLLDDGPILWQD